VKYFTPELFIKLQECQDATQFRSVNAEWERALQQYQAHLREITPNLEGGLGRLVKRGSLHDTEVVDVGISESRLTILLREGVTPGLLSLTYSVVAQPWADPAAIPDAHRSTPTLWLYDEIDRDADTLYNPRLHIQGKATDLSGPLAPEEGWKPIFRHAILLSNGWEIRVCFHRLMVTRTMSLFRPDEPGHPDERSLTRSA
jgi:hypothetical protein